MKHGLPSFKTMDGERMICIIREDDFLCISHLTYIRSFPFTYFKCSLNNVIYYLVF